MKSHSGGFRFRLPGFGFKNQITGKYGGCCREEPHRGHNANAGRLRWSGCAPGSVLLWIMLRHDMRRYFLRRGRAGIQFDLEGFKCFAAMRAMTKRKCLPSAFFIADQKPLYLSSPKKSPALGHSLFSPRFRRSRHRNQFSQPFESQVLHYRHILAQAAPPPGLKSSQDAHSAALTPAL